MHFCHVRQTNKKNYQKTLSFYEYMKYVMQKSYILFQQPGVISVSFQMDKSLDLNIPNHKVYFFSLVARVCLVLGEVVKFLVFLVGLLPSPHEHYDLGADWNSPPISVFSAGKQC